MEIINKFGKEDLAIVYLARMNNGEMIEFVESLQPPLRREEKWVLIVSTLYGCPVKCKMCDASGNFSGKLSSSEILEQIDYLVKNRFGGRKLSIPKFKVQFARMGEPSLNTEVLSVLERLPDIYDAPGLIPCISTIAPVGTEDFFDKLIKIKNKYYPQGLFQMQFSIHTTDSSKRDYLIPVKKWDFKEIADYGARFYQKGDRKIAINFAAAKGYPVDANVVAEYFNQEIFIIKITPLNPTYSVQENNLKPLFITDNEVAHELVNSFEKHGFEVILSIGELEENRIGSNCGQYVMKRQRTEGRKQKSEGRSQKAEGRRQRTEDRVNAKRSIGVSEKRRNFKIKRKN